MGMALRATHPSNLDGRIFRVRRSGLNRYSWRVGCSPTAATISAGGTRSQNRPHRRAEPNSQRPSASPACARDRTFSFRLPVILGSATNTIQVGGGGYLLLATTNDPSDSQWLPNLTGLTVNITNASVPAYINSSNYNITVADPLVGGNDAGLVKLGSGALYLTAANSYSGPTIVSNGSLYISQSVNNTSENFFVNDGQTFGAFFDGSDTPRIGNLTLGNNAGFTTLAFTNLSSTSAAAFAAQAVALNGPCNVQIQMPFGNSRPESHRDSGSQPRVGEFVNLPWIGCTRRRPLTRRLYCQVEVRPSPRFGSNRPFC
jgi:autotransporter-associated beta strand protein